MVSEAELQQSGEAGCQGGRRTSLHSLLQVVNTRLPVLFTVPLLLWSLQDALSPASPLSPPQLERPVGQPAPCLPARAVSAWGPQEQSEPREGRRLKNPFAKEESTTESASTLQANHTWTAMLSKWREGEPPKQELSSVNLAQNSETPPFDHTSCSPQPDFIHTVLLYTRSGSGFQETQPRSSAWGSEPPHLRRCLSCPTEQSSSLCHASDFRSLS